MIFFPSAAYLHLYKYECASNNKASDNHDMITVPDLCIEVSSWPADLTEKVRQLKSQENETAKNRKDWNSRSELFFFVPWFRVKQKSRHQTGFRRTKQGHQDRWTDRDIRRSGPCLLMMWNTGPHFVWTLPLETTGSTWDSGPCQPELETQTGCDITEDLVTGSDLI